MRYIGTRIKSRKEAEALEWATNMVFFGDGVVDWADKYATFNHQNRGRPGYRTGASGLFVMPTKDFITCVTLKCDLEDLPNRVYVLKLFDGAVVVPKEGDVMLNGVCVSRGEFTYLLDRYKNFLTFYGNTGICNLQLLGSKLQLEQVNELLEVL